MSIINFGPSLFDRPKRIPHGQGFISDIDHLGPLLFSRKLNIPYLCLFSTDSKPRTKC